MCPGLARLRKISCVLLRFCLLPAASRCCVKRTECTRLSALLLRPTERGFLAPSSAISDGMLHLIDHTGVEGEQATPNGVVMRFDTAEGETVASLVPEPDSPALPVFRSKM